MEFKINTNGKIKVFALSLNIPIIKNTIRFSTQIYRNPNIFSQGISSRCMDGKHILFFDYDDQDLTQIIDEIKFLQEEFKLSNAYIFELDRPDSYHAIILDKFSISDAYTILKESNIDYGYRESVKMVRGREWILRSAEKGNRNKPKYLKTIESNYNNKQISTAHKTFLELYYQIPTYKYKNEDNILKMAVINYETGNRV